MIKYLKLNLIKKSLLISSAIVALFFLYNLFLILDRDEADRIDNEKDKIITSINKVESEIKEVNNVIKSAEKTHKEYLNRIEYQKNLTIDSNVLSEEMSNFIEILNKYYDNTIFKLNLSSVRQNEKYINVAEIILTFSFSHKLQGTPDVAYELEKTVMQNVYNDITNNFQKLLPVDKSMSGMNFDSKTIKLYYIKER